MEASNYAESFHIRRIMDSYFSCNGSNTGCDFESDSDFPFSINNSIFSDRVLRIEIIPDLPEIYSEGEGCTVDTAEKVENETDSSWSMDCSTVLSIKIIHISSPVLAAKRKFFRKLFSNGMIKGSNQRHVTLRMHASEAAVLIEILHFLNSSILEPKGPKHKRPLLVRWIPPSFGKFKLNVDGASKGNPGLAGCGGVLRSHCGFIFAFSRCLEVGTSIYAELSALKYGLMTCYQLNITHQVVVETDSMLAVNWLKNDKRPPQQYCDLWEDILQLHNHLSCELIHVYREGNFLADGLANYGAAGNDASFSYLSQLPKHLLATFALDRAGVPCLRQ